MSPDLDPVAVTKPGADLPEERARLHEQAVRDGWVDLEWSPESHPGRLYGRRVARSASDTTRKIADGTAPCAMPDTTSESS